MKRFIFFCFILVSIRSFSQIDNNKSDSLIKYSYQIFGYTVSGDTANIPAGTGFFIRNKQKLFFITAKHVISGCADSVNKIPNHPQVMYVIIKDESGNMSDALTISIKKEYDSILCDSINYLPDYYIFNVDDNFKTKINSVENFILPRFEKVISVKIFGYPETKFQKGKNNSLVFPSASKISIEINEKQFTTPIFFGDTQEHNYFIPIKNNRDTLNGFSGAPVFIQEKKTNKWRIVGLFTATSDKRGEDGLLLICRIDPIIDDINSRLRNFK